MAGQDQRGLGREPGEWVGNEGERGEGRKGGKEEKGGDAEENVTGGRAGGKRKKGKETPTKVK